MALLTAPKTYDNVRQPTIAAFTLANSTNFYAGSFCALNTSQRLVPFNGTSGQILLGRLYDADNGTSTIDGVGDDTQTQFAGLGGKPMGRVILSEEILPAVTITGLGAATDIGKLVYLNGDDNTFTLTPPSTNATVLGEVVDWTSSTTGDLLVYSFMVRQALARTIGASGGGGQWIHFATLPAGTGNILASAAAAGINLPAPFHGKIVDCFEINNGVALTGGPVTLTPQITPNGGSITPVTGGAIVVPAAQATKTRQAGTAITGANEFHVGDTLDLASTTVTAITAGQVDVFLKLQPIAGV